MIILKIPFAIRKGEIICISDLSLAERGLKCGCHCVACNAPLIARMGEFNEHHFAHSTKLCDEGQAYALGMYMLMKELLDKRKQLLVPGIKLRYRYVPHTIGIESAKRLAKIVPVALKEHKDYRYKVVVKDTVITIGGSVIRYRGNKQVEALVLQVSGRELAVKIALPDSVCKGYSRKAYRGLSTLEIDFRPEDYDLNALTKQEIEQIVIEQLKNKSWISNNKLEGAYEQIVNENNQYAIEFEKKQKELLKQRQESFKKVAKNASRIMHKRGDIRPIKEEIRLDWQSEEQYNEGFKEIEKNFDKTCEHVIRDKYDCRWLYCKDCHQIKREDKMSTYGGDFPNQGRCSECF
ncbi:MAG: hypothetical protein AB9856_10600 [Cellulosilyticaceae bacterium]